MNPDLWFRLIVRLQTRYTLNEIGLKVGCSDSALARYKAGRGEPLHSVGERLIALERIFIPQTGCDLPYKAYISQEQAALCPEASCSVQVKITSSSSPSSASNPICSG